MTRLIGTLLALMMLAACSSGPFLDYTADPLAVEPPGSPNWALALPKEAGREDVRTQDTPVYAISAEALLGHFDEIALADDRVEAIPSAERDALSRAYVQRSVLFGFPDVISVTALELGVGDAGTRASLAIYSRSIYGYSDLGVNQDRVNRWIEALDERADRVR